ncbi:MAG: glycosyltransferase [Thermoleophilia bacterium]|nr:glycosyltransferase [Thermoleophilia bacterium]
MITLPHLAPETLEFVLLSFEGPDQYSMAGGLGMRVKELSLELAREGFRTHLVFVGDPNLPEEETPCDNLTLHRWSQRLSARYPGGVYDGEEAKVADWNTRLPRIVTDQLIVPAVAAGKLVAVLAEEWHTAYAVARLSDELWEKGLRDRVIILWNANNIMGFERIDWPRLDFCAQITTVSRYMKHVMWEWQVNPLVIPNGIPAERIGAVDGELVSNLRGVFPGKELIFKIGRFSPDKRWNMAMEALAEEKKRGRPFAAVIRGGVEWHGLEVLANARASGLTIVDVELPPDPTQAIQALAAAPQADVYNITSFMSDNLVSLFYSASDAVLANSGHEPFGLVGLEVMAAGGVAFVGSTGEDYAVPYLNAVVLDTDDPAEINIALEFLREHPDVAARLRKEAQETARSFTWENVVRNTLLGKLRYVANRQLVVQPQLLRKPETRTPEKPGAPTPGEEPSLGESLWQVPDSVAQPAAAVRLPEQALAGPEELASTGAPPGTPLGAIPSAAYRGQALARRPRIRPNPPASSPPGEDGSKGQHEPRTSPAPGEEHHA